MEPESDCSTQIILRQVPASLIRFVLTDTSTSVTPDLSEMFTLRTSNGGEVRAKSYPDIFEEQGYQMIYDGSDLRFEYKGPRQRAGFTIQYTGE